MNDAPACLGVRRLAAAFAEWSWGEGGIGVESWRVETKSDRFDGRIWKRSFWELRLEPYSNLAITLLRKGGGEPPHSKVGWMRFGCGGFAINRERPHPEIQNSTAKRKSPPFAKCAKDGATGSGFAN
jgi:hypothetical protein